MKNIDYLKKKILYCSEHRGTKEMDLLLCNFVKKYVNLLNEDELCELESLLNIDDEVLHKWYLNQASENLKEKFAEIQGSEQKLIEEFNKKYGDGTLDLESGTFTSNKS